MRGLSTILLIAVIVLAGLWVWQGSTIGPKLGLTRSAAPAGPNLPDLELRENQVIRIYDVVFDYENLLGTDRFYRTLLRGPAFQTTFGTAEFHHLVGKYLNEREQQTKLKGKCLLAAAYRCGVPVFTSSPGDSSIGMNVAALQLEGCRLAIDPMRDVNQSAAVVWAAKSESLGEPGALATGGT